jgi:hypothetical protein
MPRMADGSMGYNLFQEDIKVLAPTDTTDEQADEMIAYIETVWDTIKQAMVDQIRWAFPQLEVPNE